MDSHYKGVGEPLLSNKNPYYSNAISQIYPRTRRYVYRSGIRSAFQGTTLQAYPTVLQRQFGVLQ